MEIQEKIYEGEGLNLVFDNGEWVVGIKNYKSANDIANLEMLEKHNRTDEQFVLLSGACLLVGLDDEKLSFVPMKQGVLYNIPSGMWHTTVMEPGTRMILCERSGTCMDNSELLTLSVDQIKEVKAFA